MTWLLATIFCTIPAADVPITYVDAVEINHVHDDQGRPVLDQIILWELADGRHRVVDWRLSKCGQNVVKTVSDCGQKWQLTIWDQDRLVRIQAASYRETWTQHDPELADRERWPVGRRRGIVYRSSN